MTAVRLRWTVACCVALVGSAGVQAQEPQDGSLNTRIDVAEELSRTTGRPILVIAGSAD